MVIVASLYTNLLLFFSYIFVRCSIEIWFGCILYTYIGLTEGLFKKYCPLFRWYHAVNFVLLSCFLLAWNWIPQELNSAFFPIIGTLWLASGYSYWFLKRKNGKNKR
jgi:hypothetical protein